MNVDHLPGSTFLDTNIFVYSFDTNSPKKQEIAQQLVQKALYSQKGIISSQVVQEFLNVALRKFKRPMSTLEARAYLDTVLMPLCQHYPMLAFYQHALRIKEETSYSLYDSLIVAAAIESGCKTLLSEDMHHQHTVNGLQILNPFVNG